MQIEFPDNQVTFKKENLKVQYFSKWRHCWCDFKNQPPSDGEIYEMKKYHYQIRHVPDIYVGDTVK